MSEPKDAASLVLWRYLGILDRLYGMYIDACVALEMYREHFEVKTRNSARDTSIFIGDGDPNREEATYQHVTKISEFLERNLRDGENQRLLSQTCIVLIYSIWDTSVRPEYSKAVKKKQDAITSDLMGDLRVYRNAIIHGNAVLEKETKTLQYAKQGEAVLLTRSQSSELFSRLFDEMSRINAAHVGEKFDLKFERRLNSQNPTVT